MPPPPTFAAAAISPPPVRRQLFPSSPCHQVSQPPTELAQVEFPDNDHGEFPDDDDGAPVEELELVTPAAAGAQVEQEEAVLVTPGPCKRRKNADLHAAQEADNIVGEDPSPRRRRTRRGFYSID